MDVCSEFVDDGIDRLDRQAVEISHFLKLTLLLLFLSCFSHIPNHKVEEYPLIDYNGNVHFYKHDLEKIIFATHNRKITKFCRTHRDWEHIQAVWSRDKVNKSFRWNYFVTKDRKSFKK